MKIVIRSIVTIMMMISLIIPISANNSVNELVLQHVNQERASLGRKALRIDTKLSSAAAKRSEEIVEKFSHTRPNGKEWSSIYDDFNIFPLYIGENVAKKSYNKAPDDAQLAHDFYSLWKNSPGHYQNMVKSEYDMIGLSIYKVGNVYYMTQLFNSGGVEKPKPKPTPKPDNKESVPVKDEKKSGNIPVKETSEKIVKEKVTSVPKKKDQSKDELKLVQEKKHVEEKNLKKEREKQLKFELEQARLQKQLLEQQEQKIKRQTYILIGLIASIISLVAMIIYLYFKK